MGEENNLRKLSRSSTFPYQSIAGALEAVASSLDMSLFADAKVRSLTFAQIEKMQAWSEQGSRDIVWRTKMEQACRSLFLCILREISNGEELYDYYESLSVSRTA